MPDKKPAFLQLLSVFEIKSTTNTKAIKSENPRMEGFQSYETEKLRISQVP